MWYEILPSAFIIYAAFNLSAWGTYGLHKLFLKNAHRRDLTSLFNRKTYIRDRRLMNNPYLMNGLETITGDVEGDKYKPPPTDPPHPPAAAGVIDPACPCPSK